MTELAILLSVAFSSATFAGDSLPANRECDYMADPLFPKALTTEGRKPTAVALKTNAIPWAATIMNIAGEIYLSERISVSVPVLWCPWFIGESHALRVLALQPEARWWFEKTGHRHFAGLHLSAAWFNLRHNGIRYQDSGRPLLGAGATYGYRLRLNRSLDIEFSIGAGYMSMRYDRFYNVANGALVDTRQTSYFGLDHAGISLVYNFNL